MQNQTPMRTDNSSTKETKETKSVEQKPLPIFMQREISKWELMTRGF